ncbi:mCG145435, partial [Mus musculus]
TRSCFSFLKRFGRRVMNSPEIGLILWVGRMTRSMKAKSPGKCRGPLLECAVNPRGRLLLLSTPEPSHLE